MLTLEWHNCCRDLIAYMRLSESLAFCRQHASDRHIQVSAPFKFELQLSSTSMPTAPNPSSSSMDLALPVLYIVPMCRYMGHDQTRIKRLLNAQQTAWTSAFSKNRPQHLGMRINDMWYRRG